MFETEEIWCQYWHDGALTEYFILKIFCSGRSSLNLFVKRGSISRYLNEQLVPTQTERRFFSPNLRNTPGLQKKLEKITGWGVNLFKIELLPVHVQTTNLPLPLFDGYGGGGAGSWQQKHC